MDGEPPRSARLLLDFGNTVDVEDGTDLLTTPAGLGRWLHEQGLVDTPTATEDDLRLALDLRAGLRATFLMQVGERPADRDVRVGEAALCQLPLVATLPPFDPAAAVDAPAPAGPPDSSPDSSPRWPDAPVLTGSSTEPVSLALSVLAAALVHVVSTGEVSRLKQCPDDRCGWLFWDRTRSRTRRWCTMRVCGNRAKARRYAARQRVVASA